MQLATPMLVPIAVRIVMSVWITSFQMSRFSIVPITIYHLQCTIQLFSSPPSQGGSGRASLSPFWPVTLQRYKTVPRDVKRHPRFGGDLTLRGLVILSAAKNLSAQAKVLYRWCLQILRSPQNDKKWKLPVCLQFLCRLTIAKSGFVRIIHVLCNKGEGKDGRGARTNAITVITDNR